MKKYTAFLFAPYIVASLFCLVILSFISVQFALPSQDSFTTFSAHLLLPLALLFILKSQDKRFYVSFFHDVCHKLLILVSASLAVWLHFALKITALVWNPNRYDDLYDVIDQKLSGVLTLFKFIATLPFFNDMGGQYHVMFMLLFLITTLFTYLRDYRAFCLCLSMFYFNFIIGGLTYSIAPAYGPFTQYTPYSTLFLPMMQLMQSFTSIVEASGGRIIDRDFFTGALAAMPSLHVAQVVCMFWAIFRSPKGVLRSAIIIVFSYATVYIMIWAVLIGFHYIIDLVFGVLLAIISIAVCEWLCRIYIDKLSKVFYPQTQKQGIH